MSIEVFEQNVSVHQQKAVLLYRKAKYYGTLCTPNFKELRLFVTSDDDEDKMIIVLNSEIISFVPFDDAKLLITAFVDALGDLMEKSGFETNTKILFHEG